LPPSFGTLAQICWIVQCCNWCETVIEKMELDSHMFSVWFSKMYICGSQEFDSSFCSGKNQNWKFFQSENFQG
jgi:hypothetical protein